MNITEDLHVDDNVSIGTRQTNSQLKLEVTSLLPQGSPLSPVVGITTPNAEDFLALSCGSQSDQTAQISWKQGALCLGTASDFDRNVFSEKLTITEIGNVGIGTREPKIRLEIDSGNDGLSTVIGIRTPNSEDSLSISCGNQNDPHSRFAWKRGALRFGTAPSFDKQAFSESMRITETGNLGIGTDSPLERLEVRGNIKLGTKLDLFALGGLQNMRVVVGRVGLNGEIVAGQGFSIPNRPIKRKDHASYTVRFTKPFLHPPIVVVSGSDPGKWEDNIANTYQIQLNQFQVSITDGGKATNVGELSEFNFIAIGLA